MEFAAFGKLPFIFIPACPLAIVMFTGYMSVFAGWQ